MDYFKVTTGIDSSDSFINLFPTPPTVYIGQAATTLTINGAGGGTLTLGNNSSTINIGESATTLNIGKTSTSSFNIGSSATTVNPTYNFATGATASGYNKTINLGTAGLSGSTVTLNIGSDISTSTTNLYGKVLVKRNDATQEGGQIDFARSTDNTSAFTLDVYGSTATPSFRVIDNNANVRWSIDGSGLMALQKNISYPATTTYSGAGTMAAAAIIGKNVLWTGGAATLTIPTAASLDSAWTILNSAAPNESTIEWTLINGGSGTVTIAAGTNHTLFGTLTLGTNLAAKFITRKIGTTSYSTARMA